MTDDNSWITVFSCFPGISVPAHSVPCVRTSKGWIPLMDAKVGDTLVFNLPREFTTTMADTQEDCNEN